MISIKFTAFATASTLQLWTEGGLSRLFINIIPDIQFVNVICPAACLSRMLSPDCSSFLLPEPLLAESKLTLLEVEATYPLDSTKHHRCCMVS